MASKQYPQYFQTKRYNGRVIEVFATAQMSGSTAKLISGAGVVGLNREAAGVYSITSSMPGLKVDPYEFIASALEVTGSAMGGLTFRHTASDLTNKQGAAVKFSLLNSSSIAGDPVTATKVAIKWTYE